jgi:hypothetical protein
MAKELQAFPGLNYFDWQAGNAMRQHLQPVVDLLHQSA